MIKSIFEKINFSSPLKKMELYDFFTQYDSSYSAYKSIKIELSKNQ